MMKDGYPKESRIPIIELPQRLIQIDRGINSYVYEGPNGRIIKVYRDPSRNWARATVDKLLLYQDATNLLASSAELANPLGTVTFENQIEMEVFMIVHPMETLAMTSSGIVYAEVDAVRGPTLKQAHERGIPSSLLSIEYDYQLGYKAYQDMQTGHTKAQFQKILERGGKMMTKITRYNGININTMSNMKPRFNPQLSRVDLIVTDICSEINAIRR